jgi:hypothetical protein
MKRGSDNLSRRDRGAPLDENISRLLKTASDSTQPSRRFTESLIDSALLELSEKDKAYQAIRFDWLEKTMGWAAMVAAACSAGLAVAASILLKMNFAVQAVVVSTVIFNWLTYLGEYLR